MPRFVGSDLGLHCLPMSHKKDARLIQVSHLFIAALWPPAGKGLTSQLSFVMFNGVYHFPMWYPVSGVMLNCIDS